MMLKKMKIYIYMAIAFSVLSTTVICCIPLTNISGTQPERIAAYLMGALFWLGIVAEQISLWRMKLMRKSFERRLRRKSMSTFRDDKIELISFFRNTEAKIADKLNKLHFMLTLWTDLRVIAKRLQNVDMPFREILCLYL